MERSSVIIFASLPKMKVQSAHKRPATDKKKAPEVPRTLCPSFSQFGGPLVLMIW
jgi:hypothetical protein